MKIHGLTVCVNYSDYLSHGIGSWTNALASTTVVTDMNDSETVRLAESFGCSVHRTDAFTRDGAAFNKGRAMEEARVAMPWSDWILFFDADVVPPKNWLDIVEASKPECGFIHGAPRYQCDDPSKIDTPLPLIHGDGVGVGYFQLFHSEDSHVQGRVPLIGIDWMHAGNYDNELLNLWPRDRRRLIGDLRLVHLGSRDNWFGRGKKAEFDAMQAERRRRGGTWNHERIVL